MRPQATRLGSFWNEYVIRVQSLKRWSELNAQMAEMRLQGQEENERSVGGTMNQSVRLCAPGTMSRAN